MVIPADTPTWLRVALEELASASARADRRFEAVEAQLDRLAAAQENAAARLDAFLASTEQRLASVETQLDRLDARLDAFIASTEQRLAAVEDQLARLDARLDGFIASTERRFDALETLQEKMLGELHRLEIQSGTTAGWAWEVRVRDHAPNFLRSIARRVRPLPLLELDRLLDAAVADDRISDDESDQLRLADLVCTGRDLQDRAPVLLVAELSARVALNDVDRASQRAAIARKLGQTAIAVVVGERIGHDAAARAEASGVQQVIAAEV